MNDKNPTLTLLAAAELMGIKQRWARDLLHRRHKSNPEMGLLVRPSGSPRGNLRVDARALREILRGGTVQTIEDLTSRVGMLESDMATANSRIKRIERKVG